MKKTIYSLLLLLVLLPAQGTKTTKQTKYPIKRSVMQTNTTTVEHRLDSIVQSISVDSEWVSNQKDLYVYNDDRQVISHEKFSEDENIKFEWEYRIDGEVVQYVSEWDEKQEDWLYLEKYEYLYEGEIELMLAVYYWDEELNEWIGQWKFENTPLPQFEYEMSYRSFDWDMNLMDWYVSYEYSYELLEIDNGTDIQLTVSTTNYDSETKKAIPYSIVYYSKFFPQIKNEHLFEKFGYILALQWNEEQSAWVNDFKTITTINEKGDVLEKCDSTWLTIDNVEQWAPGNIVKTEVNKLGLISVRYEDHWQYDFWEEKNKLIDKMKIFYTYNDKEERINEITQTWDFKTESWKNTWRMDTEYDEDGNIIVTKNSLNYDSSTQEWIPYEKHEYAYNTDGSTSYIGIYNWNHTLNDYRLMQQREFIKDEYGEIIYEYHAGYDFYAQDFFPQSLHTKKFDINRNLVEVTYINTSVKHDTETDSYYTVESGNKEEFVYLDSANGILDYEVFYDWDDEKNEWKNTYKNQLISNIEIMRSELVTPFDFEAYDNQEIARYFSAMPLELLMLAWDEEENQWVETEKHEVFYTEQEATGLQTTKPENLTIYPNPVIDVVYVQLQEQANADLSIFDIQGRKLLHDKVQSNSKVDLSHFEQGVYFYQLKLNNKTFNGKLIKK